MKRMMILALALLSLVSCFSYPATRFEEVRSLPGRPGVKLTQPDGRMSDTSFARSRDGLWGVLYGDVRWRNMLVYFTIMEKRLIHLGIFDDGMKIVRQAVPIHSEARGETGWRGKCQGLFTSVRGFLIVYLAGDDLCHCEYDTAAREIVNRRCIKNALPGATRDLAAIEYHDRSVYFFREGTGSISLVRADLAEGKAGVMKEYPGYGVGSPVLNDAHAGREGMYALMSDHAGDHFRLYYDSWDGAVHAKRKIGFPTRSKAVTADYHPALYESGNGVILVIEDGNGIWRKEITRDMGADAPWENVYSSGYLMQYGKDERVSGISCTDSDCYALISTHSTGRKEILSFKSGIKKDISAYGPMRITCIGDKCLCENSVGEITFLPDELLK